MEDDGEKRSKDRRGTKRTAFLARYKPEAILKKKTLFIQVTFSTLLKYWKLLHLIKH